MKKRLLVLPLLALALIACDNSGGTKTSSNTPNTSQNNSSETPNTNDSSNGGTTSEAPKGTETNPYTVAEAIGIVSSLTSDAYSEDEVHVTGYVSDATSYKDASTKFTFHMVDDLSNQQDSLYVYLTLSENPVYQNDKVVVKAYLQNYKGNTNELTGKKQDDGTYTESRVVSLEAGTSTITADTEGKNATVTLDQTSGTNGSTFTFSVQVDEEYELDAVKVNNDTVTEADGKYTGTIKGNTVVTVETHGKGEAVPTLQASIDLKGHALAEGSVDGEKMVFTENGITITNEKASSSTAPSHQTQYEQRFYQGSNLKVEYTSEMKYVVFTCYSGNKTLNGQTVEGLTIEEDSSNNTIKITLNNPATSFEITNLAKQIRVGLVAVYA